MCHWWGEALQLCNPAVLWDWVLYHPWGLCRSLSEQSFALATGLCWRQVCMRFDLGLSASVRTDASDAMCTSHRTATADWSVCSSSLSLWPTHLGIWTNFIVCDFLQNVWYFQNCNTAYWVYFWHVKVCFSGHQQAPNSLLKPERPPLISFQHVLHTLPLHWRAHWPICYLKIWIRCGSSYFKLS